VEGATVDDVEVVVTAEPALRTAVVVVTATRTGSCTGEATGDTAVAAGPTAVVAAGATVVVVVEGLLMMIWRTGATVVVDPGLVVVVVVVVVVVDVVDVLVVVVATCTEYLTITTPLPPRAPWP
jgi:hypothetical protein